MAKFTNLDSYEGLLELNKHLAVHSYMVGSSPSEEDRKIFNALAAQPDPKWTHITRWFNHIKYFSKETRDSWGSASPVELPDKHLVSERYIPHPDLPRNVVILELKPADQETDFDDVESKVRSITLEGLEWKASSLAPAGFGLKKLQIMCHVAPALLSVEQTLVPLIERLDHLISEVDVYSTTPL
eukprot:TRINITY_DN16141_c0_g1_i1.p1 TRINITY_DN16141_c0_g1~~TRINITY_DN16141_c0_g1_i1.p1  ORF type:complete len:192 (-),score=15.86 TRINITY_DN16141_c0_g1_i1:38-592(-)